MAAIRKAAAWGGVLGPVALWSAWISGGLTDPNYEYRRWFASDLASGDAERPWIMLAGFFAAGVLIVAFAFARWTLLLPGRRAAVTVAILVAVVGISVVLSGAFRQDCAQGTPECADRFDAGDVSTSHQIHFAVAFPVFVPLAVLPLTMAVSRRNERDLRPYAVYSGVSGVATLGLIGIFVSEAFESSNGVVQQLLIAIAFGWLVVTGILLRRLDARPPART